jgi:hypothetical protein
MRRSAIVAASVAGVAMSTSGVAVAAPPTPVAQTQTIDAGVFCDFPIIFSQAGKTKTIEHGAFTLITSPGLKATLTNGDTGKTVTYSITGAFHNTTLANGNVVTRSTGRSLLGDPVAGLVIAIGNFSFTNDAKNNNVVPLHGTGSLINICEALG